MYSEGLQLIVRRRYYTLSTFDADLSSSKTVVAMIVLVKLCVKILFAINVELCIYAANRMLTIDGKSFTHGDKTGFNMQLELTYPI